jgi:hypothetical protein
MLRSRPLLVGLVGLVSSTGLVPAAGAGSAVVSPSYEWELYRYPSDGAGGFGAAVLVEQGTQPGGALLEGIDLAGSSDLEAEVFASDGAADFWAGASSPFVGAADAGDPVGARAELGVSLVFRKDAADATLRFTIPQSELSAAHFFGPDNEGLSGIVAHSVDAGGFFTFLEEAELSGTGGNWIFDDGTGALPYVVVQGDLDQNSVRIAFSAAFEQEIDLSSVALGEEFTVTYRLVAEAIDTVQAKSGVDAFGYDRLVPADGVSFEFSGLTQIGAPEPGAPLLLAAGAALLATCGRRRASRREA